MVKQERLFLTDAQLKSELERCEYCEEKPCKTACPANCSPADFIMAAKVGNKFDIKRAAAEILTNNPLGGICGLVCPDRHCKSGCVHAGLHTPINIPAIQASIIQRAKEAGIMPEFKRTTKNGKKVAIVGAGPAGLGAAAMLAGKGYSVTLFDKENKAGGACQWIPDYRLPKDALQSDINFVMSLGSVEMKLNSDITDYEALLKEYDAVLVTIGLPVPIKLGIAGEEIAVGGTDYLKNPGAYEMKGTVAVVGGGATATDCAVTAKLRGAEKVEMFSLEKISEMPLDPREREELLKYGIEINGRVRLISIKVNGKIQSVETIKVTLPADVKFNLKDIKDLPGTEQIRKDIDHIIVAIGNRSGLKRVEKAGIFYGGDCECGPTTVVEAVAAGKNAALAIDACISGKEKPVFEKKIKSNEPVPGYDWLPVSLETDFFGRKINSPFLLSAAPPSDGYEQMKKAYQAGWAGGVMKTAFDGIPIHIPGEYMHVFDKYTYGNCDNVSGHPLKRVCEEVKKLVKEFPDRLTIASTGGPVTGNDEADKKGWQSNTKKLEEAGVMAIEYSLSCPQGGDGTEGDIVSQNPALTAKIIDWVMEVSNPEIPKLFKLTGAVTSIALIVKAIKKVFDKYPDKKAGITLANTFPALNFRKGEKKEWDEGIIVGMSGNGVTPISYLTLSNVCNLGVTVSGNGGPMTYKAAADFLALGAKTVQFCTVVTKHGYGVIDELKQGISHLMAERGIKSIAELTGIAAPHPVRDFMALTPVKKISTADKDLCLSCGNCTRCPYLAITLDEEKHPKTDPEKCIGCSICVQKCFSGALSMRERTAEEAAALKED